MDAIRVMNLRNLEDTGFISIKPLTILIGQNSSGKSTFLRTLPLFRQSVEERITGPLLWYGRYVDFGSYLESANKFSLNKDMCFGFRFVLSPELIRYRTPYQDLFDKRLLQSAHIETLITLSYKQPIDEDDVSNICYVSRIDISINDKQEHYILQIDSDGKICSLEMNDEIINVSNVNPYVSTNILVPTIRFEEIYDPEIINRESIERAVIKAQKEPKIFYLTRFFDALSNMDYEMLGYYSKHLYKLFKKTDVMEIISDAKIELTPVQIEKLTNQMQLAKLIMILRDNQKYFYSFAKNCTYIAPVRATAERFYRLQNLSVDDVDFQGKNLAVLFQSLNPPEQEEFNRWIVKYFNFHTYAKMEGGQLSIFIKEGDSNLNLADTGFGYSQLLPIITQLWLHAAKKKSMHNLPFTFSIEQPELHLHPRMQARLADALVDAVTMSHKEKIKLRLIIETHSETIVNRLGHRIMRGNIKPEDINIVIFDRVLPDQSTKVSISKFDDNGFLNNWPYGFFEPDIEE